MKRWLLLCLAAVAAAPLAGCEIHFGGDDDECIEPPVFDEGGHRNPHNGQCEPFNNGGGTCGGDQWAFEAPVAFDWGDCPSACEQLGEQECLASPDCHATYVDCAPGGDCHGPWMFNQCWDLPPSGGNYGGEQCEGMDAEGCNRNADCVSNYHDGDSGEGYPSGGGPLDYDSCAPEGGNFGGCFSQADCPDGTVCTAETECLPPPGCMPGQVCPDVCFGHCVPGQNSCAGVDCAPGYHCEELCTGCDPGMGCDPSCQAACVPDENFCPIDCPPDTVCVQVCAECDDPANPICGECHAACVPVGGGACEDHTCPMGQHCEELCLPCDPPPGGDCPPPSCEPVCVPDNPPPSCANVVCPDGSHCEDQCTANPDGTITCQPVCVPDGPPPACENVVCMPGTHCEVHCTTDPAGNTHCERTCVPDANGCAAGDCPMGTECVQTCVPPPPGCMGGPIGCPPTCTVACVPVQPATCETQMTEAACEALAGCEPVYQATCTPNPDGTFTCAGFTFIHCQAQGAMPPFPPMQ